MKKTALTIGTVQTKKADEVTLIDEDRLWETGILGRENSKQLLATLMYYINLHVGCRGREEMYNMTTDCFEITICTENKKRRLVFSEKYPTKARNFGIRQSRLEPRAVSIFELEGSTRCVVSMFEEYMSRRPKDSIKYMWLAHIKNPVSFVWYKRNRLGIHQVSNNTKNMMAELGVEGNYSSTSLRRTHKCRSIRGNIFLVKFAREGWATFQRLAKNTYLRRLWRNLLLRLLEDSAQTIQRS